MGTVRVTEGSPARVYKRDSHGILTLASLKIGRLYYTGPLFENDYDAAEAVREYGKADTDYVILTVRPN